VPLRRLDHVLVLTDHLEATTAFYCNALGFEEGDRPELPFPECWLYLDGVCCLHVAERTAYEAHLDRMSLDRPGGPVDHLAFAAGDRDALVARLEAAGLEVVANDVPSAGIRQLFLTDPSGVRIELNVT
jgi:catechol 2,3-dioxygenase-like lactoylglutathione lyase family enzyme